MTDHVHDIVMDQVHDLFTKYKSALIKNVITINLSVLAILITIFSLVLSSIDTKLDKIITIAVSDGQQDVKIETINSTLFRHDNEINELKLQLHKFEAIIREEKPLKNYADGH